MSVTTDGWLRDEKYWEEPDQPLRGPVLPRVGLDVAGMGFKMKLNCFVAHKHRLRSDLLVDMQSGWRSNPLV